MLVIEADFKNKGFKAKIHQLTMQARKVGSVELYEIGKGSLTFLSIAKLHGEEYLSRDGVLKAMSAIDKTSGSVRYVAVPEVNTTDHRSYEGVNLNYDFGLFQSGKTKDVCKIVSMYDPVLIVDHHDTLVSETNDLSVILSNNDTYNSIEFVLAKKLIRHICSEKGLIKACSEACIYTNNDGVMMPRMEIDGLYYYDADFTLEGYLKKGMAIEVSSRDLDDDRASDIHKECDLFLKGELERLLREGKI